MKWLTNVYDPTLPDAKLFLCVMCDETYGEVWDNYLQWLRGKIIGEPEASEYYNVEELKRQGMVGVYINK